MKLKVIGKKVFIDDKEISSVSKLSIHKEFKIPDRVVLEFYVDEVEESPNKTDNKQDSNITLNIDVPVISEKVINELSEKLKQANSQRL